MTIPLSAKVQKLKASASMAAKQKISQLQASGREILDFTLGEPDFSTPEVVIDAAVAAMRAGDTHYTASAGTLALRQAISDEIRKVNGVSYALNEIVVGSGAKHLIGEVLAATLNPGDEVIIPAPYWVSYPDIVALNEGVPVIVPCGLETGFRLTAEALEAAITPRSRWLIINAPSNPTGCLYSAETWLALAEVLRRHPQVAVLTDEIYGKIVYDGKLCLSPVSIAPDLRDRCVMINGMSKAYAMTGWRLGYAAGPASVIGAVVKLIGQGTSCACSFAQTAAITALSQCDDDVARMLAIYDARRRIIVDGLNQIPGITCAAPEAAFYVFPDVRSLIGMRTPQGQLICNDLDLANYFLEAASVSVMDGSSYGMKGFLRLSFATSEATLRKGISALSIAVKNLEHSEKAA